MAGEIIKTTGLVLTIHPWSRTSHIVTWLTPDRGSVSTLVKGAVRPKSAFLGQYDLFYTCELLYYARARGELHAIREITPVTLREPLRTRWREATLAGYATSLVKQFVPSGPDAADWFTFLSRFLDTLAGADIPLDELPARFLHLELNLIRLAGLQPDFSGYDLQRPWNDFSIDRGQFGDGARIVRLSPQTTALLTRLNTAHFIAPAAPVTADTCNEAIRFLGFFLAYHLSPPADIRRSLVKTLFHPLN